jgi:hypothetical protein
VTYRDAVPDDALFSSAAARSNRAAIEAGDGLLRTSATVAAVARRLGLRLLGVEVVIVDDTDEVDYLDAQGACACTPFEQGGRQIRLGPASFSDEETLARTLAHELVHVEQIRRRAEVSSATLSAIEAEAYDAEADVIRRLEEPSP